MNRALCSQPFTIFKSDALQSTRSTFSRIKVDLCDCTIKVWLHPCARPAHVRRSAGQHCLIMSNARCGNTLTAINSPHCRSADVQTVTEHELHLFDTSRPARCRGSFSLASVISGGRLAAHCSICTVCAVRCRVFLYLSHTIQWIGACRRRRRGSPSQPGQISLHRPQQLAQQRCAPLSHALLHGSSFGIVFMQ